MSQNTETPDPASPLNPGYLPPSMPEPCTLEPDWQPPSHCHKWGSNDVKTVPFAGGEGKHPYPSIGRLGHLKELVFEIPKSVLEGIGKTRQGNILMLNTSEWSDEAAMFMWHLPQNRLLLIELLTYACRALDSLEKLVELKNVPAADAKRLIPPVYKECFGTCSVCMPHPF